MKYAPNLNNPQRGKQIREKIKLACGWAYATFYNRETVCSRNTISKRLGRSNDALGNYLRTKLLICVNSHIKFGVAGETGIAKTYTLNMRGYQELLAILDGKEAEPIEFTPGEMKGRTKECVEAFLERESLTHTEEIQTGQFKLEDKNKRLFHSLQHLPKELKAIFWKGKLDFNYDIECCAPTLIYQQAKAFGLTGDFEVMELMLSDVKAFRQSLADRTGITYQQAKVLINALFCGATLGRGNRFELFRLIGSSFPKMEALRDDAYLAGLRQEIKDMWKCIAAHYPFVRRRDKAGRMMPLSCKQKWSFYFEYERLVLDEVREYLSGKGIKCFPEHDGWRTNEEVDVQDLQSYLSGNLGFSLKIRSESLAETITTTTTN